MSTPEMTPAELVVRRYLTHVNDHDVEAALSCLAGSFRLTFVGTDFELPKKAAADALAWDAGATGHIEWRVTATDDRTVTVEGHESNEFLSLLGIGPLPFRSRYEVAESGLIGRQTHEVEWGATTLETAMKPLVEWAAQHEARELAEIHPGGKMVYTRRMAERWVALARRWRGRESG